MDTTYLSGIARNLIEFVGLTTTIESLYIVCSLRVIVAIAEVS